MRRDFRLPEADEEHLEGRGLPWEAVVDGNQSWVLVHDWPIPAGYNCQTVTVALMIPPAYPDVGLDMVYFDPALSRLDGRPIGALSPHQAMGRTWQRWSRHYTGQNPWRIGMDDISTHLILIGDWLRREFGGVAA